MDDHDGVGDDAEHEPSRPQRRTILAGVLLGVAWAWWVVSLPPFSAWATVAVVGSGLAALVAGAFLPRPERAAGVAGVTGIGAWAVVAVAAGAWQMAAYLQHPREDHPTLSYLANALLDTHPARAGAFVLWLWGAAALARR